MRVIFLTRQDRFSEHHSSLPHATENFKNFELFRTIGSTSQKLSSPSMKMLTIAPHLHIRYGMEAHFASHMPSNSTVHYNECRQYGCDSTRLKALAEKYGKDCLEWNRCEAARAAVLKKSEAFMNEVLDDADSVMSLTEEERQELILVKK
ncbi:hypothetical protein TNCV_1839111 [Trichonephila clavipes]|nr:hypothetical protein TNCV_1839111 [Trichonephila clavipes]